MDRSIDADRMTAEVSTATLERWFAEQGDPPRFDLARSGAAGITVSELLDRTGESASQLLDLSLDYGAGVGSRRLRRAVLRSLHAPSDAGVVIASGAVEALLLLCIATRDRGEVLVGSPQYSGLVSAPHAAGCRTAAVPVWSAAGGLSFERLASCITPSTALVVINTPHNPSGACASLDQIDELADCCSKSGALLVVDEVARGTLVPGAPSAARTRGFARGTVVVLGDVSKSLGLGGLRIGWLSAADPDLCDAAAAAKDGTTVASSTLSERLAAIALESAPSLLARVSSGARANLAALSALLDHLGVADRWSAPADGLVAFPAVPARDGVDRLVAELRRRDVAALPGSLFGEPDRLRLGLGARTDVFSEGLRRLDAVLAGR